MAVLNKLYETIGDFSGSLFDSGFKLALNEAIGLDEGFDSNVLKDFSINVSDMFRDPEVFKTFREKVVPYLNTFPFIRLWVAGCSSGEEVYSLAIILKEEGVYNKCQIYATDMNPLILDVAKEGIYPIDRVAKFTENYQRAGGKESFSDYYNSKFESIIMSKSLKKNIVFSVHNLTVDKVFNEMHFISCRNVMIYFTEELQENVLQLFLDSLYHGGFLCIGTKESLQFTDIHSHFEEVEAHRRIYKNRHV